MKKQKREYRADRNNIVGVRLSTNELNSLKSKAKASKMSQSQYVRSLLK